MVDKRDISINNPRRLLDIKSIYDIITRCNDSKNKVELHLNEPVIDMSYISIVGKEVVFPYGQYLDDMFALSDNIEVDPLLDGNIEVNITFYNTLYKGGK